MAEFQAMAMHNRLRESCWLLLQPATGGSLSGSVTVADFGFSWFVTVVELYAGSPQGFRKNSLNFSAIRGADD